MLDGGLAGQLEQAPFYRGGYSLLIAPLLELGSNPTFVYHLVLVLNAALAASVFPLLYLLLTRFAGVRPELAIWAALAGAVYPALTVLSQVAMSENALFPLVCVWLIAFGGLLASTAGRARPRLGGGARRRDRGALGGPQPDDRRGRARPRRHGLADRAPPAAPGRAGPRRGRRRRSPSSASTSSTAT